MLSCVASFGGMARWRAGVLACALIAGACASKAATSTSVPACKHPVPPHDTCQERWCDNPFGVGMPCTAKGGECKANDGKAGKDDLAAVLCAAAFSPDSQFCTMPCVEDSQCGANAVCRGDPKDPSAGKGCVLKTCAGDSPDAGSSASGDAKSAGDATATGDAK